MFNITNTIKTSDYSKTNFHPETISSNFDNTSVKSNTISDETLDQLKNLARTAKRLNDKFLKYTDIADEELDYLRLPQEYLDYRVTKEDLAKHVDPIIILNLSLLCKNNIKSDELTKWVLLGFNPRLAKRIVDLTIIEKEYEEFSIHPRVKESIKILKGGYKRIAHQDIIKNISIPGGEDEVTKISSDELRKRMDPYTSESLKLAFNCPRKEEEAFRWVLRGMPLLAAIDKVFLG